MCRDNAVINVEYLGSGAMEKKGGRSDRNGLKSINDFSYKQEREDKPIPAKVLPPTQEWRVVSAAS